MGLLRMWDRNGDGLDQEDLAIAEKQATAMARAVRVGEFLRFDGDGDGKVTRDEIVSRLRAERKRDDQALDRQIDEVMRADSNGDGVIDFEEMRLDAAGREAMWAVLPARVRELFALDPNDDGRLEAEELRVILSRAFAMIDRNRNSIIDDDEAETYQAFMKESRRTGMPALKPGPDDRCDLPKPGVGDQVIALAAEQGGALASLSVAGDDKVTSAIRVRIEEGSEPIFLVLSGGSPIIWRIEGDAGRLSQVVVLAGQKTDAGKAAAGVTGVPTAKSRLRDAAGLPCDPRSGGDHQRHCPARATQGRHRPGR